MDGTFTVQASWTGQQPVQVQTLDGIRLTKAIYPEAGGEKYFADYLHPVTGRLSLEAGDGTSLLMAVETGDDATVNITITSETPNSSTNGRSGLKALNKWTPAATHPGEATDYY